jgi:hypothetical protein
MLTVLVLDAAQAILKAWVGKEPGKLVLDAAQAILTDVQHM